MKGKLFAETLRALGDDGVDWKGVVCLLAEKHPESVARIISGYDVKNAWKNTVREVARHTGNKVAAIKEMRELTGASLRDAKEWVEYDAACCRNGGWVSKPMSPTNGFRE